LPVNGRHPGCGEAFLREPENEENCGVGNFINLA
jgi:hypothetical protein